MHFICNIEAEILELLMQGIVGKNTFAQVQHNYSKSALKYTFKSIPTFYFS